MNGHWYGKILPLFQYNLFSSTELSKIAANVSWTCWGKDSKRCLSFGSDVMLFKPLTRSGLRPPLMVKGGWRLSSEAQIRPYCKSRPTTSSIRGGKALQKRTKAGNTGGNSCWRSSAVSTEKGHWLDRIQRCYTLLHISTGAGMLCRSALIRKNIGRNSCWRSSAVSTEKGLRLDRIQSLFTILHITTGVERLAEAH